MNDIPVAAAGNGFIILIVLLGLFWFVLVMPSRRKQRAQRERLSQVEVGTEIVTVGGLIGKVVEAEESELKVEIANGVVVRVSRRAVAGILTPEEPAVQQPGAEDPS